MKLCFYHNCLTSSWEKPKEIGEQVKPNECEWCIDNRIIIETAGGPEKFMDNFHEKLLKSLLKNE